MCVKEKRSNLEVHEPSLIFHGPASELHIQEYFAHKKSPLPFLGPPQGPRHMPTVGS